MNANKGLISVWLIRHAKIRLAVTYAHVIVVSLEMENGNAMMLMNVKQELISVLGIPHVRTRLAATHAHVIMV